MRKQHPAHVRQARIGDQRISAEQAGQHQPKEESGPFVGHSGQKQQRRRSRRDHHRNYKARRIRQAKNVRKHTE